MTQSLLGRRILVTRPAAQAAMLAAMIAGEGSEPVLFPLLEIGPADDPAPLDEAIARHADQIAFVSQPAKAQVDFQISRQTLIEGYSA